MPTFGPYETAQRLFLSGVGGLYALKGDEKRVIKVLQPPEGIWSAEQIQEEVDGFLLRGKTQKKVAAGSKSWAAIHDVGVIRAGSEGESGGGEVAGESTMHAMGGEKSGAYAVMDRYERSAQSLVDGRVNLNNDDLRKVMSGIIQGLLDIQKIASRPHGNLKPANVLLTDSTNLAAATVHLADPAPDGALNANSAKKDLVDLGKMLYLLVNLRPYDGGTIGKSKDWNDLGPNGEDWRKLCNALLDEGAPAEERDLEKILPKIQKWTAKPRKNRVPILLATGAVVLLMTIGVSLYIIFGPKKLEWSPQDWEKLTLTQYQWFEKFSDQLADENVRKRFSADPYPVEVAKLFDVIQKDSDFKASNGFRPSKIALAPKSLKDLAIDPTEDAKKGFAPNYTRAGVEFIVAVEAALKPDRWPLLGRMEETAKAYDQRGWKRPAAGIRSLIESAKPPELPLVPVDVKERIESIQQVDVFGSIDRTIKASTAVTDIEARWAKIQEQLQKLPAGDAQNVPLIRQLPRFASEFPRSEATAENPGTLEDVTALATAFNRIEQVLTELVTELNKQGQEIVYAELAKDPAVQVPENEALTPQRFAVLPTVAKSYVRITDDPRKKMDWAAALAAIQSEQIDIIAKYNGQDANLAALRQSHKELTDRISGWAAIPAIEKNRQQLATLVEGDTGAEGLLRQLTQRSQSAVAPYLKKPQEFIADMQGRIAATPLSRATPVVYAEWKAKHELLLAKLREFSRTLTILPYDKYQEFESKFKTLEQVYTDFDGKIPTAVPGLSEIGGAAWDHTIAAHVATTYRESALKDIMTNASLKWLDDLPLVSDETYLSYQRQRLAAFDKSRADTLSLIADYKTMIDRLDRLQLLVGEPAQGAASWRDLYVKWRGRTGGPEVAVPPHTLLSDGTIAAAVKPIGDRVAALLAVDGMNDYRTLTTAATSPAPEIALTAWRKLGGVAVTQELPVLDDEDKSQTALAGHFAKLTTARLLEDAQLQKLNAELAAQRPLRWRRWAETLTGAKEIETALDKMAAFRVTLTPQTDAAMIYNQKYYDLKKRFTKDLKEPEVKALAQPFLQEAQRMPAAVAQNPDVKDLLDRITKALSSNQDDSNTAGAGPKLAKWEEEAPREGIKVFYFPNKAGAQHTLEFVRMQVGGKSIYLCTTEMSAGLFFDVVNNSGKFADIDNAGKPDARAHWFKVADDPWNGPRVWKITDRRFSLNSSWIFRPPQLGANPLSPEGISAAPTEDMPMQQLSPWSAMYGAGLLGCRLPTSEEWAAAYERFEGASAPAGVVDRWNLRGAAWIQQHEHAKRFNGMSLKFPDDGIYLNNALLFASTNNDKATPWTGADLAKTAPNRVTNSAEPYKGSVMWFRRVGAQHAGSAAPGLGQMHDLVGNVAEYVFDGTPEKPANAVVKTATPTIAEIDAAVAAQPMVNGRRQPNLFVVGGSSLSPPQMPFHVKQELNAAGFAQAKIGFSDVGVRLAYTAPIDSIIDVLASAFNEPKYLPAKTGR